MRLLATGLLCASTALATVLAQAPVGLKVIVVDGDEAANIVQEKIAAEPVIEVRDREDRKVAGAVVRFQIRRTLRNRLPAAFGGGRDEVRTLTDAAGRARATALTPLEPGRFEIEVQVSHRGETARTTIRHTNFSTTSQARSAGREPGQSSGSPGTAQGVAAPVEGASAAGAAGAGAAGAGAVGAATAGGGMGLGKLALIGLTVGGAGAGAAVALNNRNAGDPAARISAVTASARSGIQAVTAFTYSVQPTGFRAGSLTYQWEFGDGATASGEAPSHVYGSAGRYAVAVTVSAAGESARSETSVTVVSLSGTWAGPLLGSAGIVFTLDLTQAGSSITGVESTETYSQCVLSGSAQTGSPAVILRVPPCRHPTFGSHAEHEYRLELGPDGQQLTGTVSYPLPEGSRTFSIALRQ